MRSLPALAPRVRGCGRIPIPIFHSVRASSPAAVNAMMLMRVIGDLERNHLPVPTIRVLRNVGHGYSLTY